MTGPAFHMLQMLGALDSNSWTKIQRPTPFSPFVASQWQNFEKQLAAESTTVDNRGRDKQKAVGLGDVGCNDDARNTT